MKRFNWRDITGIITSNYEQKIFVKAKNKNKVYVTTIKDFLLNKDNKYSYCWLPISEKQYLFKNIHKAFFFNSHQEISRPSRSYNTNNKELFHILNYDSIISNLSS